jgi:hypothetical protein
MMNATAPHTLTGTVTDLLDIDITVPDANPGDITAFTDLAGFAVRDNPRRAHLIVSKILGKHIPVPPQTILDGGYRLADAVTAVLDSPLDEAALVVGYCETATGLGHAVAERLHATYLHTTRKQHPHIAVEAQFDEEHSHAVAHLIQPDHGISLAGIGPLILVDDELSTGKTALNTIEALHAEFPRPSYIIATLLDARTPAGRDAFTQRVAEMGVDVRVASVLSAYLTLPEDVLDRATGARAALPASAPTPTGNTPQVRVYDSLWPENVASTARHGMREHDTTVMVNAAQHAALAVLPNVDQHGSILVLGTEELLHAPTHLGAELARHLPDAVVLNQSTTRSPVHAADDPDYAIRRTVTFTCPDDPGRVSRVHNLIDPTATPAAGQQWADLTHTDIVVVVDAPESDCTDMVEALKPYASGTIHLITVPAPPTL